MKYLFWIFVLRIEAQDDSDYPSYNLCKIFDEDMFAKMLPDMGLENAWPKNTENPDYVEKGEIVKIGDMEMYVVGEGPNAIIWNYDVFGFDAGRTREYCDLFAEHGFLVVLPDYFRGDRFPDEGLADMGKFMCKYTDWENLKFDIDEKVIPFLRNRGATKFGTIGTCFGGYPIIRLASYPQCQFSIGFHASHFPMMKFTTGEDYISIFHEVTNDVLLLNSVSEPEENSEGGLLDNILTENGYKFEAKDYDQLHGWVVRGDLNDPEVKIDVENAVMRALQFALEHKDI